MPVYKLNYEPLAQVNEPLAQVNEPLAQVS